MGKADYKKIGKCWNTDYLPTATRDELFDYASDDSPSNGRKLSKRTTPKKANHKHEYMDVLVKSYVTMPSYTMPKESIGLAKMCKYCKVLKNCNFYVYDKDSKGRYRFLTNHEILEKYKDLPMINLIEEDI